MKIIIGLLLAFFILIVGCTSGLTGGTVIDKNDECSSLDGGIRDDCYLDAKKCSKIESNSVRNICVSELAFQKRDSSVCDLINVENIKGNCLFSISKETNNLEICENIEDRYWRDNCHYTFATTNNKEVFCAAINDAEQQSSCFEEIALTLGKVNLCKMVSFEKEELCVYKVAQSAKKIEFCDLLPKGIPADTCRLKLASKILEDESLCDLIKTKDVKDICHERFV